MESSCFRGKINIILCFLSGKSYSLQPDAGVGRQHLYAIGGGGEPDSLAWPNSLKNRESESAPVVELCQWNAVVCKLLNVVVRVKFMSSISGKRCVHVCMLCGFPGMSQLDYWSAPRLTIFREFGHARLIRRVQ